MGFQALSLMKNATGATITGGTAMALSSDGQEVKNGVHVADMGDDNFITRANVTFKTRNPARQSDGSYSKAKRFVTVVVPKQLTSGDIAFNLVRIEMEVHPETSASEQTNLQMLGAQVFTDSDLTAFLRNGSLA